MDGTNYFHGETMQDTAATPWSVRFALLLTVATVVLTLSVLLGLREAGALPLIADEIALAPIAW